MKPASEGSEASPLRGMFIAAAALAAATFVLLVAGGLVTSTGSGLAVPDWPLSFGGFFPPMAGGVRFEHTHRILAGAVGLATIAFALFLRRAERRRWLKGLGAAAVGCVLAQAALGGLTVLYRLPLLVSVAHACLGQIFFCLVTCIALFLSPVWRPRARALSDPDVLRRRLWIGAAAVSLQLVLGAMVRHTADKLPEGSALGSAALAAHVVGAFIVLAAAFAISGTVTRFGDAAGFRGAASALAPLAAAQFFLGIGAFIFSFALRDEAARYTAEVAFTTAHQAVGALVLAAFFLLAIYASGCLVYEKAAGGPTAGRGAVRRDVGTGSVRS